MRLRLLLIAPVLLVLVFFALSNPQPAHIAFWPFEAAYDVPLSLALLGAVGIGMLLGALMLWLALLLAHHRARRAERKASALQEQIRRARTEAPPPALPVSR